MSPTEAPDLPRLRRRGARFAVALDTLAVHVLAPPGALSAADLAQLRLHDVDVIAENLAAVAEVADMAQRAGLPPDTVATYTDGRPRGWPPGSLPAPHEAPGAPEAQRLPGAGAVYAPGPLPVWLCHAGHGSTGPVCTRCGQPRPAGAAAL